MQAFLIICCMLAASLPCVILCRECEEDKCEECEDECNECSEEIEESEESEESEEHEEDEEDEEDRFVDVGDGRYYFGTQIGNWTECVEECNRLGSSLVTIESEEENEKLLAYMRLNDLDDVAYWTSGRKTGKGDDYYWTATGQGFNTSSYVNWYNNTPDTKYNCVVFFPQDDGRWSTDSCWDDEWNPDINYMALCEKEYE